MEEISLEEAKIHLKNLLYDTYDFRKYSRETDRQAINKVLEELNNRIPKDDLKKILRRVQDYQLNYKDTVLFNIIMQEIFGETEWTNLVNKE